MPRHRRLVCTGLPHHVTQRGNRRAQVFFSSADHLAYLSWLRHYATRYQVDVLAYCLMTNHVHMVVVPQTHRGLQCMMSPLHTRHALRINRERDWKGHVWQGRYFASALDEPHFWSALRYVELNPVRAGMVDRAEDYEWSSARAHCGLRYDSVLSAKPEWERLLSSVKNWSDWLAAGDERQSIETLRKHTSKGLPCGSQQFVESLETTTGRQLGFRSQGRPRKLNKGGSHL